MQKYINKRHNYIAGLEMDNYLQTQILIAKYNKKKGSNLSLNRIINLALIEIIDNPERIDELAKLDATTLV